MEKLNFTNHIIATIVCYLSLVLGLCLSFVYSLISFQKDNLAFALGMLAFIVFGIPLVILIASRVFHIRTTKKDS